MSDEIKTAEDITNIWHIEPELAKEMFSLFVDVVFEETSENIFVDGESETTDEDSDDEVDESSEGE